MLPHSSLVRLAQSALEPPCTLVVDKKNPRLVRLALAQILLREQARLLHRKTIALNASILPALCGRQCGGVAVAYSSQVL
jgi:hypothetical protein